MVVEDRRGVPAAPRETDADGPAPERAPPLLKPPRVARRLSVTLPMNGACRRSVRFQVHSATTSEIFEPRRQADRPPFCGTTFRVWAARSLEAKAAPRRASSRRLLIAGSKPSRERTSGLSTVLVHHATVSRVFYSCQLHLRLPHLNTKCYSGILPMHRGLSLPSTPDMLTPPT